MLKDSFKVNLKFLILNNLIVNRFLLRFQYIRSYQYHFNKNFLNNLKLKVLGLLEDNVAVLDGPFVGLNYLKTSYGSSYLPKILGSYESELHTTINLLREKEYSHIVDIGSAEGYYAVGFAKIFPHSNILAFDINEDLRFLIDELKSLNGNSDRVSFYSGDSVRVLKQIPEFTNFLFFIDCEGWELDFLSSFDVMKFERSDLIIEVHDYVDPNISLAIEGRFRSSHVIRKVFPASKKNKIVEFGVSSFFLNFTFSEKTMLVDEGRYRDNFWMVLISKIS